MKDLLSALIHILVRDSDEVKHLFEEIKPQLPEVLQIKLWPAGHLPFFQAKVEKVCRRIEARTCLLEIGYCRKVPSSQQQEGGFGCQD
jgi:hypothetical protein